MPAFTGGARARIRANAGQAGAEEAGVDNLTTMVTLVEHPSPDQARRWFDALCELYDEVADSGDLWAEFRERLPGTAAAWSFDEEAARRFVEGVEEASDDPAGWLTLLGQNRGELAAWYAYATAPAEADTLDGAPGIAPEAAEGAVSTAGRFSWLSVDPGLQVRVQQTFSYQPEHYEEYLGPYLASVWGIGWEAHPAEHKQAWLDQLLTGMEAGPAEADASGTEAVVEAEPEPTAAVVAVGAEDVAAARAEIAQVVADTLVEVPEAAELPAEVIQQLVAEVLEEQAAAAGR